MRTVTRNTIRNTTKKQTVYVSDWLPDGTEINFIKQQLLSSYTTKNTVSLFCASTRESLVRMEDDLRDLGVDSRRVKLVEYFQGRGKEGDKLLALLNGTIPLDKGDIILTEYDCLVNLFTQPEYYSETKKLRNKKHITLFVEGVRDVGARLKPLKVEKYNEVEQIFNLLFPSSSPFDFQHYKHVDFKDILEIKNKLNTSSLNKEQREFLEELLNYAPFMCVDLEVRRKDGNFVLNFFLTPKLNELFSGWKTTYVLAPLFYLSHLYQYFNKTQNFRLVDITHKVVTLDRRITLKENFQNCTFAYLHDKQPEGEEIRTWSNEQKADFLCEAANMAGDLAWNWTEDKVHKCKKTDKLFLFCADRFSYLSDSTPYTDLLCEGDAENEGDNLQHFNAPLAVTKHYDVSAALVLPSPRIPAVKRWLKKEYPHYNREADIGLNTSLRILCKTSLAVSDNSCAHHRLAVLLYKAQALQLSSYLARYFGSSFESLVSVVSYEELNSPEQEKVLKTVTENKEETTNIENSVNTQKTEGGVVVGSYIKEDGSVVKIDENFLANNISFVSTTTSSNTKDTQNKEKELQVVTKEDGNKVIPTELSAEEENMLKDEPELREHAKRLKAEGKTVSFVQPQECANFGYYPDFDLNEEDDTSNTTFEDELKELEHEEEEVDDLDQEELISKETTNEDISQETDDHKDLLKMLAEYQRADSYKEEYAREMAVLKKAGKQAAEEMEKSLNLLTKKAQQVESTLEHKRQERKTAKSKSLTKEEQQTLQHLKEEAQDDIDVSCQSYGLEREELFRRALDEYYEPKMPELYEAQREADILHEKGDVDGEEKALTSYTKLLCKYGELRTKMRREFEANFGFDPKFTRKYIAKVAKRMFSKLENTNSLVAQCLETLEKPFPNLSKNKEND